MSWTDINIPFHKVDVRNKSALTCIFEKYTFDGIIHFAGLKSVIDSVENLINYYDTNIFGSFVLIEVMRNFNCKTFVFSSSTTIYGKPHAVPIKENFPLSVANQYCRSKLMINDF